MLIDMAHRYLDLRTSLCEICSHLSEKELLTGKGKSDGGRKKREKGEKNAMVALLFFIWLLEGWFYLIPPPKKNSA